MMEKAASPRGKALLTFVFIAIVLMTLLRSVAHPSHYTTPDSIDYLTQANYIINQWKQSNYSTIKGDFFAWPIGYSLSIALIAKCIGVSVLVASKVVNLLFLGGVFLLLYHWFREKAWIVACTFFAYGAMEVIAHSWSESAFLFFLFLLIFFINRQENKQRIYSIIGVSFCLVMLTMYRYIGLIFFFLLGIYVLYLFFHKKNKLAYQYILALFIASLFSLAYLLHNLSETGHFSGQERIESTTEGLWEFLLILLQGLFNEYCFARDHFFRGTPDYLFIFLLVLQLLLTCFVLFHRKEWKGKFISQPLSKILLLLSVGYLLGIIVMKGMFDVYFYFDYRVMYPFSSLLFVSLSSEMITENQSVFFQKCGKYIIAFMWVSFFFSLPKKYIFDLLQSWVS